MNTFTKYARAVTNAALICISDALPFGRLWYGEPDAISNAIDYAKFRSRSHVASFAFTRPREAELSAFGKRG